MYTYLKSGDCLETNDGTALKLWDSFFVSIFCILIRYFGDFKDTENTSTTTIVENLCRDLNIAIKGSQHEKTVHGRLLSLFVSLSLCGKIIAL